ncbi:uncharacterized protein BX664DRAFT_296659 [Halteromyces radiatus]|uniref:uncharacterized protein n=1 Tax=Halteromyces radiatus TaxID=101107 RepID=UPI00221EBEE5|nr:uncharacterized protein BX664DRAFT_296659 [Halteromyces radiatus]KAI8089143.1 hypothetical protein BX664DRAFT_296659 [Halteromyces radiatus]
MDSPMTEEKGHKFRIRVRPTRWNYIGLILSLAGFILVSLCLVGGISSNGHSIHFVKIQGNNVTATFGLLGFCIEQNHELNCQRDDAVKLIPFAVTVPTVLNDTYPNLFTDAITPDSGVYPQTVAQPSHDPRILAASILCLICGGAAILIGLCKVVFYTHFQDESYTRGFCAMAASVMSLLLVAETVVMYQNGAAELNLIYPHLQATLGPGMTMIGISLLVFFLSSVAYLQGCFSSNGTSDKGYELL